MNERCNQCRGDRAVLLGKPKVATAAPIPDAAERKLDDETAKLARRLAAIRDVRLRQRIKTMLSAMADGQH